MRRLFITTALPIFVTLLAGCAGPFGTFYSDNHVDGASIEPLHERPTIMYLDAVEAQGLALANTGYVLLGMSDFEGENVDEGGAGAQARHVGASMVLIRRA